MSHPHREIIEADHADLYAILDRTKTGPLATEDQELLRTVIDTFIFMQVEIAKKDASLEHLRQQFSINTKQTEKTSEVLKGLQEQKQESDPKRGKKKRGKKKKKKKSKGHGRNSADAYTGAERITVPLESLRPGDLCPRCEEGGEKGKGKGKLYRCKPSRLIRLKGQAPLCAKCWELERLRCNLCGGVFTAKVPVEAGEQKYDESSASMIALLRYGSGLPFNRLEKLEQAFGIPLPASTQWDLVLKHSKPCVPAYAELVRLAAQGEIFYHDDTPMKILELLKENQRIKKEDSKERTGMYTTAVVSILEKRQISLFFTGRQHAGENLKDLLVKRAAALKRPIQMCDGSSRNEPEDLKTIVCNCLAHGRRKFVEVANHFPDECHYVLKKLRKVYKRDNKARKKKMSPEMRLSYHQKHSAEPMEDLKNWMKAHLAEKTVEPNSSLGTAFSYMLNRWDKITLFLRVPDAPLDNNICERALKKAIIHRKNSLFYKTLNGARVGDLFMSLIRTAELSGANPLDYLVALQKHSEEVHNAPQQWMPWNYQDALARLGEQQLPAEARSATDLSSAPPESWLDISQAIGDLSRRALQYRAPAQHAWPSLA